MSKTVGTISRGIRTPIIRSGDNLVNIIADSILEAATEEKFEIRERDIIAVTEAITTTITTTMSHITTRTNPSRCMACH